MDTEAILHRFDDLSIWKQGDQRAPHKPLLVLYALGRWQRGQDRGDVPRGRAGPDRPAAGVRAAAEVGPPRAAVLAAPARRRLDGPRPGRAAAEDRRRHPPGRPRCGRTTSGRSSPPTSRPLWPPIPSLVAAIATRILERHFPESLHQDILNAVGLTLETAATRRKRDPAFRQRVLKAYEYRCAVCGFDVRLGSVSIALDAAHIRWHQAGGPETESNGLALCVLHHKTFDLGAFTVAEGVLLVSDQANGTTGFQEALMAYHGKPIRDPQHPDWRPEPRHLEWHGREVFKGEARHRA